MKLYELEDTLEYQKANGEIFGFEYDDLTSKISNSVEVAFDFFVF